MTTRFKIIRLAGNVDLEVVDLRDGSIAGTLVNEGDEFEDSVHDVKQFTVREAGSAED